MSTTFPIACARALFQSVQPYRPVPRYPGDRSLVAALADRSPRWRPDCRDRCGGPERPRRRPSPRRSAPIRRGVTPSPPAGLRRWPRAPGSRASELRDELAAALAEDGSTGGAWVFDTEAGGDARPVQRQRLPRADPGLEPEAVRDRGLLAELGAEGAARDPRLRARQARGTRRPVARGRPGPRRRRRPVLRHRPLRPRQRPARDPGLAAGPQRRRRRGRSGSRAGSSPTTRSSTASAEPGPT